jgi:hypothetical protein
LPPPATKPPAPGRGGSMGQETWSQARALNIDCFWIKARRGVSVKDNAPPLRIVCGPKATRTLHVKNGSPPRAPEGQWPKEMLAPLILPHSAVPRAFA